MDTATPSLENLKKRAKHVVRQHADGHFPVAERIRRALPAFAGRSDREVLASPFSLHHAQDLVAHELGFSDWAQLKQEIEAMPTRDATTRPSDTTGEPELLRAHPQIFVTDMERAVRFYRDQLGFSVGYLYGEPPYYGLVTCDGVGLNLRHVDESPYAAEVRAREDLLAVTIVTRNAKALFVRLAGAGVTLHQRYREQAWGGHDFIVSDPDGNLVHFATPAET